MSDFIFAPEPDPLIDQLCTAMLTAAGDYPLFVDIQQLTVAAGGDDLDYHPILDAFVSQYEYTGLGDYWIEVPRRIARKILLHVLSESLAYPEAVMDPAEAEQFSAHFLDLFDPGSRFFTNGTCSGETAVYTTTGEEVLGWRSMSESTFDNGIIAANPQRVGIVWAEDEA